jgi:hypothetical protein
MNITIGPSFIGWYIWWAAMKLSGFEPWVRPPRPPAHQAAMPTRADYASASYGQSQYIARPVPHYSDAVAYWADPPQPNKVSQYVPGVGLVTASSAEMLERTLTEIYRRMNTTEPRTPTKWYGYGAP